MRKHPSWLLSLFQHFVDPVTAAADNLDHAVKVYARCKAEANVCVYMCEHHAAQANDVNPYEDWNAFAREKNCEHAASEDYRYAMIRVTRMKAYVEARRQQLEKARERQRSKSQ